MVEMPKRGRELNWLVKKYVDF